MGYKSKSIRPFIGAKSYQESQAFYRELDFEEVEISKDMCLFKVNENLGFYLQDYYAKDWVDNSMIFLEVDDVEQCHKDIKERGLHLKYENVKLSDIKTDDWGREFFLHDPSGVLWHFGKFN